MEKPDYEKKWKQQEEELEAVQKSAHDDKPKRKTGTIEQTRKSKASACILLVLVFFSQFIALHIA